MSQPTLPGLDHDVDQAVEKYRKKILAQLRDIRAAASELDRATRRSLANELCMYARKNPGLQSSFYRTARVLKAR